MQVPGHPFLEYSLDGDRLYMATPVIAVVLWCRISGMGVHKSVADLGGVRGVQMPPPLAAHK